MFFSNYIPETTFDINQSNIPLVEELLNRARIDSYFNLVKKEILCYPIRVKDVAYWSFPSDKISINTEYNRNSIESDFLKGETIFNKITDMVQAYSVNRSNISFDVLYGEHLCNLFAVKDLYGIVGRDNITGEIINFTHPFRVMSMMLFRKRHLSIDKLFIYKVNDSLPKLNIENVELIKEMRAYLDLYMTLFQKGIQQRINAENYSETPEYYFKLQSNLDEWNHYTAFAGVSTNNSTNYNKFLYFSDILVNNSFMPYYTIFILYAPRGQDRLKGTYLKHIPFIMPNINIDGSVCTGRIPSQTTEGVECLKISNLLSPYHSFIADKEKAYVFVKLCIQKAKEIYEGRYKNEYFTNIPETYSE